MAYLVLARKYRPKNFDSVVHQEHVTTTLKNAVRLERVAHAHIFTGPRGTGKTTIARILAKCMNCGMGPAENPCEECRSCSEIKSGSPSDVIEIDGASNNSVEQIREIRENLQYKPTHSRYKIYIIDEVHMLSTAAFNALLKSLEEPPSHIMFMFATTEPHKVPVTIMSRCQRHDLKRVPLNILTDHLEFICKNEEIIAETQDLMNIAAAAEGSVRDSMSILDQVISSSPDSNLSPEHINWVLGSSPFEVIKETLSAILNSNRKKLIETISQLYFSGTDLKIFYQKITEFLRHTIILKIEDKNIIEIPENQKSELISLSEGFSVSYLSRLLDILLKEEIRVRQSDNIRILLEIIFLKLSEIPESKSIEELLSRIEKLKNTSGSQQPALPEKDNKAYTTDNKAEKKTDTEVSVKETKPEPIPDEKAEPDTENNENIASKETKNLSDPEKWEECIKELRRKNPSAGNLLSTNSELISIEDQTINILAKGTGYHLSRLKKEKPVIEKTAEKIFGEKIRLNINESFLDDNEKKNGIREKEKIHINAQTNQLVMSIKDQMNGKVIDEKIIENKKIDSKEE
ncbi:MAG: DNA polymerase III subunit gamma/tau [Thermodesulfobacteriota bacterium]